MGDKVVNMREALEQYGKEKGFIPQPRADITIPTYKTKRPSFTEEITSHGYLSLIFKDLLKGSLKGINKSTAKFFYNNSSFARHVLENPGGEQALYDIYSYTEKDDNYTWIDDLLLSRPACEATRKRREAYKKLLSETMNELYNHSDMLYIADLGSGRGSIPLETAYELLTSNGKNRTINLTLVDKDARALNIAQNIARLYNLEDNTNLINDNVKHFVKKPPHRYDIIGTHGLLDYFSDDDAVEFFDNIADVLFPSGYLITTNMAPHKDKISKFLMEKIGNWKLIYRTPGQFEDLINQTGKYNIEDVIVVDDREIHTSNSPQDLPSGFHVLIRAKKKPNQLTLFF